MNTTIRQELVNSDNVSFNDYVLKSGGPPPQDFLDEELDEQDIFLFSAWAHGVELGDTMMKFSLFSYIQSHLQCRSSETLEKYLLKSIYWEEVKNGKFKLTTEGVAQLKRFGEQPKKVEVDCNYTFSRIYKSETFSVTVDSLGRKKMYIGTMHTTAAEILRKLRKDDINFNKFESEWTPDKVFSWIIYDQDYTWVRS